MKTDTIEFLTFGIVYIVCCVHLFMMVYARQYAAIIKSLTILTR